MHCAYCALGVLRASLRIRDRTSVKQTSRAGPVPSLVGAALGRLASSRRCAVSLIRGLRGSAIGRILEAQTAKSSRGACRTLLATRINALPAACVYRAPWIFDGVSSAGPSQGGRRRQSGGYQFSHAVSLPTPATIKSAIHHWRGYWLSHIEICTHRSRMDREKIPCKIAAGRESGSRAPLLTARRTSQCPCRRRCTGWRGLSWRCVSPSRRAGSPAPARRTHRSDARARSRRR